METWRGFEERQIQTGVSRRTWRWKKSKKCCEEVAVRMKIVPVGVSSSRKDFVYTLARHEAQQPLYKATVSQDIWTFEWHVNSMETSLAAILDQYCTILGLTLSIWPPPWTLPARAVIIRSSMLRAAHLISSHSHYCCPDRARCLLMTEAS